MPQMTLISREQVQVVGGTTRTIDDYAVTGLSRRGPGGQAVPFPAPLSGTPVRVHLTRIGGGIYPGGQVTLDSSQGAADPSGALSGGKLGFDENAVYIFSAGGSQCLVTVEY